VFWSRSWCAIVSSRNAPGFLAPLNASHCSRCSGPLLVCSFSPPFGEPPLSTLVVPTTGRRSFWLRLGGDSGLYLIGTLAARAAGLLLLPLYTRFLSPNEYGVIELLELITQVAALVIGAGLFSGAMIRIYYDYRSDRERKDVLSTALSCTGLVCLPLFLSLWVAAPFLTNYFLGSSFSSALLRCAALGLVLSTMVECGLTAERIRNGARYYVCVSLACLLGTLLLNVLFIVYLRLGIVGFLASKLIVYTFAFGVILLRRVCHSGFAWNTEAARSMVAFGLPLITANVAFFAIHFSDRFFLRRYTSLSEVGLYSLGYRFGFLITLLVGEPFGRAWNIQMYDHFGVDGWKERFSSLARCFAIVLSAASLAICVFGREVVRIVASSSFERAADVIPIVVAGYAIRELADYGRTLLYANKRSGRVAAAAVIAAVVNLILNFVWIRSYGMMGAAWSTVCTWICYALLIWLLVILEFNDTFGVGWCAGSMAVAGALYALATGRPPGNSSLQLVVGLSITFAYPVIAWWGRLVPTAERMALNSAIVRAFQRARRPIL
jgi:O-antigen/teichoic acid export membrane protein